MDSAFVKEGQQPPERIAWCDIYKGIVIMLVVIGHATGKFNQYIYQFHMAAFFFISGYTGHTRDGSLFEKAVQKFYKLFVPYLSIGIAGIWVFWVFDKAGVLSRVSMANYPESFQAALTAFLKLEFNCDWLGAMWFLPALFLAEMVFTIAARVFRKDYWLVLFSFAVFFYGQKLSSSGTAHFSFDLACVAQVFYMYGYLAKKVPDKRKSSWHLFVSSGLLLAVWMLAVNSGFTNTVDWPVRKWNGAVDLVLPVFGILLTANIAKWVDRIGHGKKLFLYLGKNSMGIMCFHFIGFKAAYLAFIFFKVMPVEEVCRLTPPESVSERYWLLAVLLAVAVSCMLWGLLQKNPMVRLLIGCERADKISRRLLQIKLVQEIGLVCRQAAAVIKSSVREYVPFFKYFKYAAAVCVAAALMVWGHSSFGKIEVAFPYRGTAVNFQEGWLAQSGEEPYRWIQQQAAFEVFLTNQDRLGLTGYIPENIGHVSYVSVHVNGQEVFHKAAASGQLVEVQADLANVVCPFRKNTFEIQTDGMRLPEETEADQRSFSMLVEKIWMDKQGGETG